MKKLWYALLGLVVFMSCDTADDPYQPEGNYLLFGTYEPDCEEGTCIDFYKLTEDGLFKYAHEREGEVPVFFQLGPLLYDATKALVDQFPQELLEEEKQSIGCPDCEEHQALYVQWSENDKVQQWKLDLDKNNLPDYLHPFVDAVLEKLELIHGQGS